MAEHFSNYCLTGNRNHQPLQAEGESIGETGGRGIRKVEERREECHPAIGKELHHLNSQPGAQEPRSPSVCITSLLERLSLQPWYRQNCWIYKACPGPPAFSPLAEPTRKLVGQGLWKILFSGSSPLKTEMARQLGMEEGTELSSCFL